MMKIVVSFVAVLMFSFLVSCTKDYYVKPDAPPQNVSFKNDVIPIFNDNCVSCHNGSTSPNLTPDKAYGELVSLPNLVIPGNPEKSELYQRVMGQQGSMMPPGGMMSHNKTDLIYQWIKDGALNN